jgi:hypothetical protein
MRNLYSLDNLCHKIYYQDCDEFEKIRELCLEERNWLSKNYTKDTLKISDHTGFVVVFTKDTNEPVIMGGVFNDGRYPSNVGRMCNRLYVFPKFRTNARTMVDGCIMVHEHVVKPLMAVNNYDSYFITMQNRPHRGGKRWWDVWKNAMNAASNDFWLHGNGYIQTCNANVQQCWQNFVYHDLTLDTFAKWNPKLITDEEWQNLPIGN